MKRSIRMLHIEIEGDDSSAVTREFVNALGAAINATNYDQPRFERKIDAQGAKGFVKAEVDRSEP
jgi:hypothetical protein